MSGTYGDDDGVDMEEETWESLKDKGNAEYRLGRYSNSIVYYSDAIALKPDEASLFSNRSAAHLLTKYFQRALDDARHAIRLDPTFAKAYGRAGAAAGSLGLFDDAVTHFTEGIRLSETAGVSTKGMLESLEKSRTARVALPAARESLRRKDYAAVLRTLAPIYASFPDCFPLACVLCEARVQSAPDEVCRDLQRFSHSHSDSPDFLFLLAAAQYYTGASSAHTRAQSLLRRSLELDPENERAKQLVRKIRAIDQLKAKGNAAFAEKNWKESESFYTQAIAVDETNKSVNAILRSNRAASRMELKDFHGALSDCNFAIDNGNAAPKLFARRARILQQLDNWDEAVRDLARASESDSSYQHEWREVQRKAKQAKRKDFYKILDCDRNADERELKRKYHTAALQWHPDKWANAGESEKAAAEAKFKEVGEAFAVLSDRRKRQLYDNGMLDNDTEGAGGMPADVDVMSMFTTMFGGGFPGGGFDMGGFGGGRRGPTVFHFGF